MMPSATFVWMYGVYIQGRWYTVKSTIFLIFIIMFSVQLLLNFKFNEKINSFYFSQELFCSVLTN